MKLYSHAERPELLERRAELGATWHEFMHHDPVASVCWDRQYEEFPDLQLFLVDDDDRLLAESNAVPIPFGPGDLPDAGWDAALEQAFEGRPVTAVWRSQSRSTSTSGGRGSARRCSTGCGKRSAHAGCPISSPRCGRA